MSANEKRPVIEVTGLKKQYKLGQIGGGTLTHDLQSWWARVRGKGGPEHRHRHRPAAVRPDVYGAERR